MRGGTTDPLEFARSKALRLLAARPRSVAELRHRLLLSGATDAHVKIVIEQMTRLGYLDDRAYAAARTRWLMGAGGHLGPRGVIARLRAKGVAASIAEKAVEAALAEEREDSFAKKALAGRPYGEEATEKQNAQAARLLLRRGFSGATVSRVLGLKDDIDVGET
jgi:regulatory protein